MIYSLVGFMAAGKSTIGRILARDLGLRFIDLDKHIELSVGKSISEVFSTEGEAAFREMEYENLKQILENEDNLVLSLGGGTFINEKSRALILEKSLTFYLKTEFEEISRRLQNDGSRPLASEAEKLFIVREPIYQLAHNTVYTYGKSPYDVARLINIAIKYNG